MGSAATLTSATITANGGSGILVDSPAVIVNVNSAGGLTTVSNNVGTGILVDRIPTQPSEVNSLIIDGLDILGNGTGATKFPGIWLRGSTGNVTATIRSNLVHGNGNTGILVEQGTGNATRTLQQFNDVFQNALTLASDATTVGGILFRTSSTLTAFGGNRVHGNGGHQLGFNAPPNLPATQWSIASTACNASSNSLFCYAAGKVGLNVAPLVTVDAANVHWQVAMPAAGADYSATGTVLNATPSLACTPVTTCP
jgi:hypothetical protein